jgi:NADH-quinone oxidoreductase subunit L
MFVDYALWIPLLPALGWLIITLFSKSLGNRGSAWLATTLMAASAALSIGVFAEVVTNAPVWKTPELNQLYKLEKEIKTLEKKEKAESKAAPVGENTATEEPERSGESTTASETTDETHSSATGGETHTASPELLALEERAETLKRDALEYNAASGFPFVREWSWLSIKGEAGLPFGLYFDQLAAIMILMVSVVATLIHLFSIGYMAGEERYPTFFSYINLFAAAMLAMVMAKNLFHVLLFWEIMGLMSYLLIGFFYKKKSAQQAQKKAFLTVRVGDLAFMAGLFWLYSQLGTLDIPTIIAQGATGELATALGGAAFGIGLLLFIAAVGKSAQFPLHVWLPDAMEGPTPVSAMIHAATMVAAGVYLVARAFPIMDIGGVLPIIAWVGGFTALFAATMAPAQADAKKIMAFSTLSQLGLMFMGLGVFGFAAAMFHLLTHAFFKALLFLGSGSMIHGAGTQDVFEMDRLAKYQKWTLGTVWVGALSLMGFPLFAGFWSKDEILHVAQGENFALYLVGCAVAILTAFYTTRMMIVAFYKPKTVSPWGLAAWNQQGEPTLNMTQAEVLEQQAQDAGHGHSVHAETEADDAHPHHPHESGPEMIVPLVLLGILAMTMGFLGSPFSNFWFQRFVYFGATPEVPPLETLWVGFIVSAVLVVIGAGISVALYWNRDHTKQMAPDWLTRLLQRRYFIDDFYYASVAKIGYDLQYLFAWFDRVVVDGFVDFVGGAVTVIGDTLRRAQTGAVGWYAGLTVVGTIVMVLAFAIAFAGGAR